MQDTWLSLTSTKKEERSFKKKTTSVLPFSQLSKITSA